MPAQVKLTDLESPTFSKEVGELFDLMATMAQASPLDSAAMHEQARQATGLADFGPRDYEERLDVLLAAINGIDGLSDPGRVSLQAQLLQLLKNRLLLTDYLKQHPEVADLDLLPPVVIAGLPRTGTTHLHNLLSAGPTFRTLPYWESVEPLPLPTELGVEPDPRRARMDVAVDFMNAAMPHFRLMHEMTTDHVHEEIQLLANDFSTMFFETIADVPAWRDYYQQHDQAPHYAYLRTQLQILQHARGGRRWLLKSPQHLEQLPVLDRVFPGTVVIVTHRDPVSVVVSMATMVAYSARMYRSPVPAARLGQYWRDRIDTMLTALIRDREVVPPGRSLDVRFADFMGDEFGVAARVYELAGEELTPDAAREIRTYLAGHTRGRLGSIDYQAEAVGLDPEELRERFAPYCARFL
ncbi:MAG TPA: sulfotransferase [Marmoricola sp.]|nr:sulfotransferase [Marmoricola sp.]